MIRHCWTGQQWHTVADLSRRISTRIIVATILAAAAWLAPAAVHAEEAGWEGVDKTVVEKVATEAGHPPRAPFINTDQGDLLLFMFLLAGAGGGFVAGYSFRSLFPPRGAAQEASNQDHASHS
jgi:cobalt/nickel transport system permease protein